MINRIRRFVKTARYNYSEQCARGIVALGVHEDDFLARKIVALLGYVKIYDNKKEDLLN